MAKPERFPPIPSALSHILARSLSDMGDEARIEYPKRAGAWSEESAGEQPIP
jgi:hypothetical protein